LLQSDHDGIEQDQLPSDEEITALESQLAVLIGCRTRLEQRDPANQHRTRLLMKSTIRYATDAIGRMRLKDKYYTREEARDIQSLLNNYIKIAQHEEFPGGDTDESSEVEELPSDEQTVALQRQLDELVGEKTRLSQAISVSQQLEGSQPESDAGSIRESIEPHRRRSKSPLKRPSFQTALNVIGESAAKKRRNDSSQGSMRPPKEKNQVHFIREGTPAPETERAGGGRLRSPPPRPNVPPFQDNSFESKLTMLKWMGCKDEKLNNEILFSVRGDLEQAIDLLAMRAETSPPPMPNATSQSQSPATNSKSHTPLAIDDPQIASLREMGFLDDDRNAIVLAQCDGDVSSAVDILVAMAEEDALEGTMEIDGGAAGQSPWSEQRNKKGKEPEKAKKEDKQPATSTDKQSKKSAASTKEGNQPKLPTQQTIADATPKTGETPALAEYREAMFKHFRKRSADEMKQDSAWGTKEGSRRASDDQGGDQDKEKDTEMMDEVNKRLQVIEESMETVEDEEMEDVEEGEVEEDLREEATGAEGGDDEMSGVDDGKEGEGVDDIEEGKAGDGTDAREMEAEVGEDETKPQQTTASEEVAGEKVGQDTEMEDEDEMAR
jgi:hypothetical protein